MIEIRRAQMADKPAIFDFLSKAYQEKSRYKFPERWEWQFEKNPFRRGDELPIWVAVDEEGMIVGQICVMFEPFKIEGKCLEAGCWAVDIVVLPEYRDQKIGSRLFKAIFIENDIFIAILMSDTSRHLITKMGGSAITPVSVYTRLANFNAVSALEAIRNRLVSGKLQKVLLQLFSSLCMDRAISTLVNLGIRARDLHLDREISSDIQIGPIERFDHRLDEFWNSAEHLFHACVQRTSQYLNWKYLEQPFLDYKVFGASRNGNLCGYIILRCTRAPEADTGIIADLFVPFQDIKTLHSLLAFSIGYFKDHRVKYIEAASSAPTYKKAFEAMGFKKIKVVTPLFHNNTVADEYLSTLPLDGWFFGRGDHDWDQFPYA